MHDTPSHENRLVCWCGCDASAALGTFAEDYDGALGFSTDVNNDRSFLGTDQAVFFQMDVVPGYRLDLESLSFDSLKSRGFEPQAARVSYAVFINPAGDPSVDGLLGDFDFVYNGAHDHGAPGTFGAGTVGASFSTGRWTLSVPESQLNAQQNLTGTQTIAIGLYGSPGVDQDFGIDNLLVTGQLSAIPEPGCVAVLLFAIAVMAGRRRRDSFAMQR